MKIVNCKLEIIKHFLKTNPKRCKSKKCNHNHFKFHCVHDPLEYLWNRIGARRTAILEIIQFHWSKHFFMLNQVQTKR